MNCSLTTLTDRQLAEIMHALGQDQPMTHATLIDMAQVTQELDRRFAQTLIALDESLYSEASDIDRYLPLAGRA